MWKWLLWQACGGATAPGLSEEAVSARKGLEHALVAREPADVGPAAKKAAQWEGKDAPLDILLGDALANVLMRTEDGLRLLEANKRPEDPKWAKAYMAATMRQGDPEKMKAVWIGEGGGRNLGRVGAVEWVAAEGVCPPGAPFVDHCGAVGEEAAGGACREATGEGGSGGGVGRKWQRRRGQR